MTEQQHQNVYLKSIHAIGIHNRYDISITFNKDLNILHGKNGTGKTTLLHILANILNGDYSQFVFLPFEKIEATFTNSAFIEIRQEKVKDLDSRQLFISYTSENNKTQTIQTPSVTYDVVADDPGIFRKKLSHVVNKKRILKIDTAYFPAFRTMLEAWSMDDERSPSWLAEKIYNRRRQRFQPEKTTAFARKMFGDFIPDLDYPSPIDIVDEITHEIQRAKIKVAEYDRNFFSRIFGKIFSIVAQPNLQENNSSIINTNIQNLSSDIEKILSSTESLSSQVHADLMQIIKSLQNASNQSMFAVKFLEIYRNSLIERQKVEEQAFEVVQRYLDAVNMFLEGKKLNYKSVLKNISSNVNIEFPDKGYGDIRVLSSGERQILTMLYTATKLSNRPIVLIDEPELSLHVDWQRMLLQKMIEQLGECQVIVTTHSPMIAANYREKMVEMKPTLYKANERQSNAKVHQR